MRSLTIDHGVMAAGKLCAQRRGMLLLGIGRSQQTAIRPGRATGRPIPPCQLLRIGRGQLEAQRSAAGARRLSPPRRISLPRNGSAVSVTGDGAGYGALGTAPGQPAG